MATSSTEVRERAALARGLAVWGSRGGGKEVTPMGDGQSPALHMLCTYLQHVLLPERRTPRQAGQPWPGAPAAAPSHFCGDPGETAEHKCSPRAPKGLFAGLVRRGCTAGCMGTRGRKATPYRPAWTRGISLGSRDHGCGAQSTSSCVQERSSVGKCAAQQDHGRKEIPHGRAVHGARLCQIQGTAQITPPSPGSRC